jgi:AcrR family transcriptional regulator
MNIESRSNVAASGASKKGYHHGDLRQVLIDEAAKMIRQDGEVALSMRKLATQVGVSRTAPYHHFEDKQGLLCAVAEEGFRRFDMIIKQQLEPDDLGHYLQQRMRDYVNFAIENPEYYDLMFSSSIWTSAEVSQTLKDKAYSSFRRYTDKVVQLSGDHQLPDGVTPLRVAQLSWSTFHGLSRLMIDGIYVDKTALDALFDAATKLLIPSNRSTKKI